MQWIFRMAPTFVLFWLVLSGHFDALFLTLGALSVVVVCWISVRAGIADSQNITARLLLQLPMYFLWLGKEVLTSSWAVARKVWSPRVALHPAVDDTPARDMSTISQVIYANSVTLTPGTLSLDVGEGHVEIHSLDASDIAKLQDEKNLRRVRLLEARK